MKPSGCNVYAESDLLPASGESKAQCHHEATYAEAVAICKANSARLCTKEELLDRCTALSGCGHDMDHVWSSTIVTEAYRVAFAPPEPLEPLKLAADSRVYLGKVDQ